MFVMKKLKWITSAVLLLGAVSALAQHNPNAAHTRHRATEPVNGKGGEDISGPYEVVADWPQPLHSDWVMGRVAAVYAESPDRIYVATSGELPANYEGERTWGPDTLPTLVVATVGLTLKIGRWEHIILVFDRSGKLLQSWEQHNSIIKSPNRMLVSPYDPERHIWIVDQRSMQVLKFTHDGKALVMTLGEKDVPKASLPNARFSVQDMAWMPNGDFFVVGGSHVMKFSKEGKYLSGFGRPGSGPGEFRGLHGIVIDANHRLYIADRSNSRIQIFDENGKYLDMWPNIVAPYCIRLTKDGQYLWVSDGNTQKFLKYDLKGKLLYSWGAFGVMPGALWGPHDFTTDSEGNLYVAEDHGARVQKFRPKKDANPEHLIGQLQ